MATESKVEQETSAMVIGRGPVRSVMDSLKSGRQERAASYPGVQ